jgi:group I intron endonuclease
MTNNKKYNIYTISFSLSPKLQHCQQNKINGRSCEASFASCCKLNSKDNCNINFIEIKPIIKYANADEDKIKIFADNRNKAGVYRWVNNKNVNTYVGSSVSLTRRFTNYYSIGYLLRESKSNNSYMYRALLKYGYSNFSLEILEYCERENCIERENYYLDLLKPEYNILSVAGSNLGFKHSEETKAKFFLRKHSEETRRKMSESKKGNNNPIKAQSEETRNKISVSRKANLSGSSQPSSQKIEVLDLETNITTRYDSMREASGALNVNLSSVGQYLLKSKKKLPYKGRYIITKISL